MTTADAIVSVCILVGALGLCVVILYAAAVAARKRTEAQAVELDALHRREAHETDQVRLKGLPDDSLQAELSKALGGGEKKP